MWLNGEYVCQVAFYGLGLNTPLVLGAINPGSFCLNSSEVTDPSKVYSNLKAICIGNIILSLGGLIPGYYATFLVIDRWGRKPIQTMGFLILTGLFIVMGVAYKGLTSSTAGERWFVFLFCLAYFFQNFGPNTTTFIIPGEVFPTRYRTTAHGISAASGRLGAVLAQFAFFRLSQSDCKVSTSRMQDMCVCSTLFDPSCN